jgi:hypothetical protein
MASAYGETGRGVGEVCKQGHSRIPERHGHGNFVGLAHAHARTHKHKHTHTHTHTHCYLLLGEQVCAEFDFAVSAFAQGLAEVVEVDRREGLDGRVHLLFGCH